MKKKKLISNRKENIGEFHYRVTPIYSDGSEGKPRKIFKKKVRKADGAYYTKANGKYVEKQAATMTGLDRKIKKFLEDEEKKIIFGLETQRDLQAMEDMTVLQLWGEWRDDPEVQQGIAQKTFKKRKDQMKNVILPNLGPMKIRDITKQIMSKFFKAIDGVNARKEVHKVISKFLEYAVEEFIIEDIPINDSVLINLNKVSRRKKLESGGSKTRRFSLEEMITFQDKITKYRRGKYAIHYGLLGLQGLSIGEAFGLPWENVDFDNNTISVQQKLNTRDVEEDKNTRWASDTYLVIEPFMKSNKKRRTIPMCREVRKRLEAIDPLDRKGLVIKNRFGKPLGFGTWGRSHHAKVKNALKIDYTNHELRHWYGTYLLSYLNMDPLTVSKLMGHEKESTVFDHYGDEIEERKTKRFVNISDYWGHLEAA